MKEYKCENCGTEFDFAEREEERGEKICCPNCGTETAKREAKQKKGSGGRSPSEDVTVLDTPRQVAAEGGLDAGGDENDGPPETQQFGGGDAGGAGAERSHESSSDSGSSDS